MVREMAKVVGKRGETEKLPKVKKGAELVLEAKE